MLLLVLFISLFTKGALQEVGDIQQLLGFAFGHRLSAMMSSCCIVRELQCPPLRRQRVTSYQNLSNDITSGLERFSRCVCSNQRRCVLSFPANFLPDSADGVNYDVTFVTVSTTAQYTCLYNGTRALVCQGRQSMRTGMLGWVLPNFASGGGYGIMGALGSAGLLGEEMEEAMEQMMESGLPPPGPSRPPCRRCAPLRCAIAVGRETARLRAYRQIGTAQRQLYHRCLRHHGIRPPQSTTATTTTARPPIRLPMTPPTDSEPDHTTFLHTTTAATTTTTRKTTSTTTRRTTTSTTTTTSKPTTKGTTPKLPVIVTTPKIDVPKQPTTPETPTTKTFPAAATTSEAYVTTFTPKVSTTTPATTSTPQVITRILVGSGTETTSTAPRQKAVADVTEAGGGGTSIGGSGVAGVVIGVSAAIAVLAAALFFLLLRRRRRKKQAEELSGSVVAVGKLSAGHAGKHYKARPLPSVSSKKAVIDAEDADEDFEKADDDDNDDDDEDSANDGTPAGEERYTLPPYSLSASAAHRKPRLSTRSSKAGDDESLYASLDESAIDPSLPAHPAARAAVNVVGSGVGSESLASGDPPSKAAARKESKTFHNAEGLVPPPGGESRAAASQAVGGRRCGSYYNLKPGSAPPAARSLGLQERVAAADGSGNANYVNAATSLGKNPYEKPRLQGGKHMYTSLKVGNAASGDAASPQRGDTTNTNTNTTTASSDDPQSAAVTSRAPRSDIYSQPYGFISRNNGRHSAVAGRESSRVGRTSSSSSSIISAAVCSPDRSGNSSAKQDSEAGASSGGRVAARTTPAERESGNTSAATKRDSERSGLGGRESANSLVRTRESTHTSAGPKRDWERSANNNKNNNNNVTPNSARTPVSRQGSNPAAACRTGPPRVDHDGYLLPVTPRRQQRL